MRAVVGWSDAAAIRPALRRSCVAVTGKRCAGYVSTHAIHHQPALITNVSDRCGNLRAPPPERRAGIEGHLSARGAVLREHQLNISAHAPNKQLSNADNTFSSVPRMFLVHHGSR